MVTPLVTPLVNLQGVLKAYGSRYVLRRVTLSMREGERVVVLGENGCGKSTLLQVVAGVLEADGGRIEVPLAPGYAPEKPDLPDHLYVREWLDVVASLKRARWSDADVDLFGVGRLLGVRVSALSLGQRQRVSLTAALLGAPRLLVLDEPTNALDAQSRAALVGRLEGATALLATHDRALATELSARVLTMTDGTLAAASGAVADFDGRAAPSAP